MILRKHEWLWELFQINLNEFLEIITSGDKNSGVDFVDKLWEDGILIENFLKDFSYFLKENLRREDSIGIDKTLSIISIIYFVLGEFRYEEDKRLLGYVLINEVFKTETPVVITEVRQEIKAPEVYENTQKVSAEKQEQETVSPDVDISDLNINIIEKKWPVFKGELKKESIMLSAFLTDTNPVELEGNKLTLGLPAWQSFHREKIEDKDNKLKIEKILKKIYGAKIIIATRLVGEKIKNESDEFINKVIDFFDAEIIEKK